MGINYSMINNRKSDKPISVPNDPSTNTVTGDSTKIANITIITL